jgi:hypothetical protein
MYSRRFDQSMNFLIEPRILQDTSMRSLVLASLLAWIGFSGLLLAQVKPEAIDDAPEKGSVTIRLKLVPSAPETPDVPEASSEDHSADKRATNEGEGAKGISIESPVESENDKQLGDSAITAFPKQPAGRTTAPLQKPGVPKLADITGFDMFAESSVSTQSAKLELSPDPLSLSANVSTGMDVGKRDRFSQSRYERNIGLKNASKNTSQAIELASPAADRSAPAEANESRTVESSVAGIKDETKRIVESNDHAIALSDAVDPDALHEAADENSSRGKPTECPGSPGKSELALEAQADDLPLDQEEHPYDAPAARSSQSTPQGRAISDFSPANAAMRKAINECLNYYLTHPENVAKRGPWALMHAALPFGVETEVIAGNRKVNALGWMCYNGVCAKQRIFQPTKQGFRTNVGPGVQGHEGQFLAILAQSKVQSDYPIIIGNRRYTIADLVKYEMATCREKSELTFKLIGLSHYLEPNQRWRDNRGQTWNLEKMVAEELAQPVIGAACGGSHRLMGLSYAIIKRQQAGLPLDGHWKRADLFLNDYVNYAMSLQNQNGSFSTEWFEGRGSAADLERQVQTTGHILEWLIFTLPDEHLQSPRIQKSVQFLLDSVGKDPERAWPIGPRGHALRALALYNQRVFGAEAGHTRAYVAEVLENPTKR